MHFIDDSMKQVKECLEKFFLENEHKNLSITISHYASPMDLLYYVTVRVMENIADDNIVVYGGIFFELPYNIINGLQKEQLEFIGDKAIEVTYRLLSDRNKKEQQKQQHIDELRSCAANLDVCY